VDLKLGTVQPPGSPADPDHDGDVCLRSGHRSDADGGQGDGGAAGTQQRGDAVGFGSVVLGVGGLLCLGVSVLLCLWSVELSWDGCHGFGIFPLAQGLCWTDLGLVRYNKKKYW